MEMDDNKLKRILQEAMEYEADCIMEEVDSDPNVRELIAPEEIHEKLFQQIREQQEALAKEKEAELAEEQELIRLGKIYKKKRSRRKYYILIAAVVCALAVGTVSFGDGKKVFNQMKRLLGDREQSVVNTGDDESSFARDISDEEEAYKQIEEKFGFIPIKLLYLPEGMEFEEVIIEADSQSTRLYYLDETDKMISYHITTKHRNASVSIDIEDKLIQEYEKELNGITIKYQKYQVSQTMKTRWNISFVHKDAQYFLITTGIEIEEIDKIIENLYFS